MALLLLTVIYLSYISIGLPDSLLGAAWPTMQPLLQVPLSRAGCLSMIISCGTVCSSLLADRLLRRFGTGLVVSCSVLLTAAALFGFSAASQFSLLCISAIPYGLGAGAIDAALNHYVAVHYAARHMNWLHCFWGIGAAASPYIMSFYLHRGDDWQGGYRAVAVLLSVLTGLLFCSLPLWRKTDSADLAADSGSGRDTPVFALMRLHGVPQSLLTFFSYCAAESTMGLWAGSFLVYARGMEAETAARFASCYYIGIMTGRLLCGFAAEQLGEHRLIRLGMCGVAGGIFLLLLPLHRICALCGLLVAGLGIAPIYPSLIRETPMRFGHARAQTLIGMQTASAYLGTTLMPPLFGVIADRAGMGMLPLFLMLFLSLTALLTERSTASSVSSDIMQPL